MGDFGVTYALARWKAGGLLPIRHNWNIFRYRLRLIDRSQIKAPKKTHYVGSSLLEVIQFVTNRKGVRDYLLVLSSSLGCSFVLTQYRCVTNRQTDRETDGWTDKIHCGAL